jgi:hypothetical protein
MGRGLPRRPSCCSFNELWTSKCMHHPNNSTKLQRFYCKINRQALILFYNDRAAVVMARSARSKELSVRRCCRLLINLVKWSLPEGERKDVRFTPSMLSCTEPKGPNRDASLLPVGNGVRALHARTGNGASLCLV